MDIETQSMAGAFMAYHGSNLNSSIPMILGNAGFRVRLFFFRARRDDTHGHSLQGGATLLWMKTDGL